MRKNPTGIWMLAVLLVCLAPAVGGADGLIIVSNPPGVTAWAFRIRPAAGPLPSRECHGKGARCGHRGGPGVLQFQQAAAGGHIRLPGSCRGAHRQVLHGGRGENDDRGDAARGQGTGVVRGYRAPAAGPRSPRVRGTRRVYASHLPDRAPGRQEDQDQLHAAAHQRLGDGRVRVHPRHGKVQLQPRIRGLGENDD